MAGTICARRFTTLLQALLDSGYSPLQLRGAAADCLAELLAKRMDSTAKLTLIKVLHDGFFKASIRQLEYFSAFVLLAHTGRFAVSMAPLST